MKYYIPAFGELWWNLIIAAHANWLKEEGHEVLVSCHPSIADMYKGICETVDLPQEFYNKYGDLPADCWGRYRGDKRVPHEEFVKFFDKYKPEGYEYSNHVKFGYVPRQQAYKKCIWPKFKPRVLNPVLIFPRYRNSKQHAYRNLTKEFYIKLIKGLMEKYYVISMGTVDGAYNITNEDVDNRKKYDNLVGQTDSIQDVFDLANISLCTIGGTSSLTKMCGMLENPIPSFVIGHEPERFLKEENFFKVKVGFFDCGKENYQNFDEDKCIEEIIKFVEECK